jgi:Peptide methionine sulfoxide reductase
LEDLFGGLGPHKRLRIVVPRIDPGADIGFERLDAGQQEAAIASRDAEQQSLRRQIVTQITSASAFYRAEEYHQRYSKGTVTPAAQPPSGNGP